MRKRAIQQVESAKTWSVKLDGGEDLTTPALDAKPGDLLFSKNYEADVNGGYQRAGNFERFDGQAKPSEANYSLIDFDAGSTAFAEGDTVTGATSGATGEAMVPWTLDFTAGDNKFQVFETVTGGTSTATATIVWVELTSGSWSQGDAAGTLHIKSPSGTFQAAEEITTANGSATCSGAQEEVPLTSGTWGGADAAGTLALCKVSGTFVDDENLQVSAVTYAVADGANVVGSGGTDVLDGRYTQHAISNVRADIAAVPGSGDVRGLMSMAGIVYAMRDNAGATAKDLWKSTSSGWTQITMPEYLDFDAGTYEFQVGDTVTGGTSAATGVVDAMVIQSGTAGGSNLTGRLYLSSVTGTFTNNENLQVGGATKALADGANGTLVIPAGGLVESVVDNFTGDPGDRKIYGVDGVGPAFEFDGTNFYHLPTANTTDTPDHVFVHKNYLFLSFASSVQHSGLGTPRDFSAISGAVEISTGDDVTGFAKASGDVLVMFNRSKTYLLYGSVSTEWERKEHSNETGAIEWSVQTMSNPVYLTDRGLSVLQSVQEFGDFKAASISRKVDPFLTQQRSLVSASMIVKEKNQYRIFFSDGNGMHVRLDRKEPSFMRVRYGKTVTCTLSTEDTSGNEVLFFGSDDGFVYQLDVGRSADGDPIESYLRFPFWHVNTPRQIKQFKEAILYLDSPFGTSLEFTTEYDFSTPDVPRGLTQDVGVNSGGGFWGLSNWNEFVWGAQSVGDAVAYLDGSGTNVGLLVRSYAAHEQNHTLQSVIVHYIPRGLKR